MIGERGGRRCGELLLCRTSARHSTSTSGSSMRQAQWFWKERAISTWSANSSIRHVRRGTLCSASLVLFYAPAPWHFLNFLPLPHGHGSFRPTPALGFTAVAEAAPPAPAVEPPPPPPPTSPS